MSKQNAEYLTDTIATNQQKTDSQLFKTVLKQQAGVHMNTERGFPPCNHSSCSYRLLKDPHQMSF